MRPRGEASSSTPEVRASQLRVELRFQRLLLRRIGETEDGGLREEGGGGEEKAGGEQSAHGWRLYRGLRRPGRGPGPACWRSLRDTLPSHDNVSRRLCQQTGSGARGPGRRRPPVTAPIYSATDVRHQRHFCFCARRAARRSEELLRSRECMRSRGPDAADVWISQNGRVGLAHRRLAIIDLSAGGRAADAPRRAASIIFNGEIYNYPRAAGRGSRRRAARSVATPTPRCCCSCTTRWARACCSELRGMFAFAIWDGAKRRMFLARDPYGIKPLYYADDGGTLRFASQVKALLAGGAIDSAIRARRPRPDSFCGAPCRSRSRCYRAIRALPAGSYPTVDADGVARAASVLLRSRPRSRRRRGDAPRVSDARARGDRARRRARHRCAITWSPTCRSARSSPPASTPARSSRSRASAGASDLQTMTLALRGVPRPRQRRGAARRARRARNTASRHTIRELDAARDFRGELPRIFAAMDQPTVDGLNSYFISKAAAELGLKVALSGTRRRRAVRRLYVVPRHPALDAHDFASSRASPASAKASIASTAALAKRSRHISPKMGEILRHGSSYAGAYLVKRGRFLDVRTARRSSATRSRREGFERLDLLALLERTVTPDPGTPYARVAALESSLYLRNQLLRDMDWASMAHSLEVRVPLVDAHLLRKARAGAGHAQRARQAASSRTRRVRRCRRAFARAARPASRCRSANGCSRKGAWSSASAAGRARCTR